MLSNLSNKAGVKYPIKDNVTNLFTRMIGEGKATIRYLKCIQKFAFLETFAYLETFHCHQIHWTCSRPVHPVSGCGAVEELSNPGRNYLQKLCYVCIVVYVLRWRSLWRGKTWTSFRWAPSNLRAQARLTVLRKGWSLPREGIILAKAFHTLLSICRC